MKPLSVLLLTLLLVSAAVEAGECEIKEDFGAFAKRFVANPGIQQERVSYPFTIQTCDDGDCQDVVLQSGPIPTTVTDMFAGMHTCDEDNELGHTEGHNDERGVIGRVSICGACGGLIQYRFSLRHGCWYWSEVYISLG